MKTPAATTPATDVQALAHIGQCALDADHSEHALREAESRALPPNGPGGVRDLRGQRDRAREALRVAIAELEV